MVYLCFRLLFYIILCGTIREVFTTVSEHEYKNSPNDDLICGAIPSLLPRYHFYTAEPPQHAGSSPRVDMTSSAHTAWFVSYLDHDGRMKDGERRFEERSVNFPRA
jgi:hypothetical protein